MKILRKIFTFSKFVIMIFYIFSLLVKYLLTLSVYKFKSYRAYRIALGEFVRAGFEPQIASELARLVSPGMGGFSDWTRPRRSRKCCFN